MRVKFDTIGGFDNIEKWLKESSSKKPTRSLTEIASEGVSRLSTNTPKDTGVTANSWVAEVETKGDVHSISWKNTAHPQTSHNVAVLIETGHGTRNGGYVPPKPYIKQSMDPVWDKAGNKIVEELIKP